MAKEIEEWRFPQFDVVSDHSDHHYVINKPKNPSNPSNGSDSFTNSSSNVYKNIIKEWRVLEKSLPDTIHVRVYEQRVDLLRAVIVGPAGTPYHDGLFFFDLMFPPDYPTRPPFVCYRSFGMRINPNLYSNGYVCLSLLNTWHGKKKEKWDPKNSTVLQILVSIQGLVLNRAPYFNEPGTSYHSDRSKRSIAYTENCFILNCKTMIYLLRNPPNHFKEFVTWHFQTRAHQILSACSSYYNGRVRVGSYQVGSGPDPVEVSKVFKAAMKAWYLQMVATFRKAGATFGADVAKLVEEEKKMVTFKVEEKKKVKKTVSFKKVVTKIRKFLGIKKVSATQEVVST